MLKQLSIFAENKKGTMQQITQILFENDVNILGSVNNDSAEYGIVRMVVSDPDKAEQALQAAGYMTRQTDVLGVEVVDQPGNLNSLLKTLLETNIDIDSLFQPRVRLPDHGVPCTGCVRDRSKLKEQRIYRSLEHV